RAAPGKRPHHRSHGQACGHADGPRHGQRGPLRQHLVRLDPAGARPGGAGRADGAGFAGAGRGVRRGLHLGERRHPVVTIVICPGQGAQKVGMGRDLAERFPVAAETFAAVDQALGVPLSQTMWEGPEDELTLTHNAQPAILAHSAAVLAVAGERLGPVVLAAGHSLGEYTAYIAAGSLTVAEAARLVRRRAERLLKARP